MGTNLETAIIIEIVYVFCGGVWLSNVSLLISRFCSMAFDSVFCSCCCCLVGGAGEGGMILFLALRLHDVYAQAAFLTIVSSFFQCL